MDNSVVVQTKSLTKRYGDMVALDQLSINLERGRILGFIGPNGAGKTTTIKILVGLCRPTSGSAMIDGVDCTAESNTVKRLVGYMPDTFGSYDNMRVREYLDFFAAAFRIPRKQRRTRIEEVMEITKSTYMKDRFVDSLSHGMKQRVGIARTLLHDPSVLILDEPANGLDPQARIEIRHVLLQLAAMGKTLIVTSHILPELSRICDVVAMITRGRLRAFGTLEQVMRDVTQWRNFEVELSHAEQLEKGAELVQRQIKNDDEMSTSPAEAMIRFRTKHDDRTMARLLASLTTEGVEVVQFKEVPLDLEDAFLSVTNRDEEISLPTKNYPDTRKSMS